MKKKLAITRTVDQLAGSANPLNPRKITPEQLKMLADSLRRFGDLSGLILNVRTNHLVGGHQRVKVLGAAPVEITKKYDSPTPNGTVAEGFVIFEEERYTYREVSWDERTENAAMIAANKHGGDWDFPALGELLVELDKSEFDLTLTGFSAGELEKMVRGLNASDGDNDEIKRDEIESLDVLPAHVRMVQLFLTVETLPQFLEQVRSLQEGFGSANITDTVIAAVDESYHHRYDSGPKDPTKTNPAGLQGKEPKARPTSQAGNGAD
jgi:ParB-like chromosome segregation protein Spo0J